MNRWDERERRIQEEQEHLERAEYMFPKFLTVAKKYAKLNGVELIKHKHDGVNWSVYDFLNEARFIDFAYDECGEIFNLEMFSFELDEDDVKHLRKAYPDMFLDDDTSED